MTTAQLNAAAKELYKEHMTYENGYGSPSVKWKNLDEADRELYRSVIRRIYSAATR